MRIFFYIKKIAVNYPILLPFAYHLQNCAELGFFFFFEIAELGTQALKKKQNPITETKTQASKQRFDPYSARNCL